MIMATATRARRIPPVRSGTFPVMALRAIDYEQIRQLLAGRNFAIDLGDADGRVACFEDGAFECSGA